jgi:hypothetical protein
MKKAYLVGIMIQGSLNDAFDNPLGKSLGKKDSPSSTFKNTPLSLPAMTFYNSRSNPKFN